MLCHLALPSYDLPSFSPETVLCTNALLLIFHYKVVFFSLQHIKILNNQHDSLNAFTQYLMVKININTTSLYLCDYLYLHKVPSQNLAHFNFTVSLCDTYNYLNFTNEKMTLHSVIGPKPRFTNSMPKHLPSSVLV